jgi:hypothetical protein
MQESATDKEAESHTVACCDAEELIGGTDQLLLPLPEFGNSQYGFDSEMGLHSARNGTSYQYIYVSFPSSKDT